MPITWTEDSRNKWVVVTYTDPYTSADFTRALNDVLARRRTLGAVRMLVDRRNASAATGEFVERVISFGTSEPKRWTDARVALVVSGDAAFGMGRILQTRAELSMPSMAVSVFRDLPSAEVWLARPESAT